MVEITPIAVRRMMQIMKQEHDWEASIISLSTQATACVMLAATGIIPLKQDIKLTMDRIGLTFHWGCKK